MSRTIDITERFKIFLGEAESLEKMIEQSGIKLYKVCVVHDRNKGLFISVTTPARNRKKLSRLLRDMFCTVVVRYANP